MSQEEEFAAAAMSKVMDKIQEPLSKISYVFGERASVALIVRFKGENGCLLFSPENPSYDELIQSLREAQRLESSTVVQPLRPVN